jgi:hypothetical protein
MKSSLVQKIVLLFLLFNALLVGVWAQFAPASFYESFPGNAWTWVSVDGPFNEHLIRDVGGLNLAIAVLALFALLQPTLALLRATALVTLTYQLPHVIYHLIHVSILPTTAQQVMQSVGLLLGVVASLVLLLATRGETDNAKAHSSTHLRI